MRKSLVFSILCGFTASAASAGPHEDFCKALAGLAREVRQSRAPQHIRVVKSADEPLSFACGHGGTAAGRRFCSTAFKVVGIEFTHVFPWRVYDCLRGSGIRPAIETTEQYTGLVGRRRIARLRAAWKGGLTIDIRFEPAGDFSDGAEWVGYYGTYQMVVALR